MNATSSTDTFLVLLVWTTFFLVLASASIAAAVRELRHRARWRKAIRTANTFWTDQDEQSSVGVADMMEQSTEEKHEQRN